MTAAVMSPALDALVQRLQAYRLPTATEVAFQDAVARVLDREGHAFAREYQLSGKRGRIDFYLPDAHIGLELKIAGQSPSDVARQLQRYTQAEEIAALILVTARRTLGRLPHEIGGKPVRVAACWRGGL